MDIKFDPEQAFLVAERIEINGAKFYRRAAEIADTPEAKKLLNSLATWEDEHREFFEKLRTDFSGLGPLDYRKYLDRVFEPDKEQLRSINELADSNVILSDMDPADRLKGDENLREILEIALEIEKDSLVFYTSLSLAMKASSEGDALSSIIKEEMRHISILTRELAQCKID